MEALKLGIPNSLDTERAEVNSSKQSPIDYLRMRLLKYVILLRISVPFAPKRCHFAPKYHVPFEITCSCRLFVLSLPQSKWCELWKRSIWLYSIAFRGAVTEFIIAVYVQNSTFPFFPQRAILHWRAMLHFTPVYRFNITRHIKYFNDLLFMHSTNVKHLDNIYRSEVTFELYDNLRCFHVLYPKKATFSKYCLTQWISKLQGSFEIHWVRQYLVNFTSLVGMINATVNKI